MTIEGNATQAAAAGRAPRIRLGMVGGGAGAFIGAVHRIAARLDDQYELVAGALSSDPDRARASGAELGLAPERCVVFEVAPAGIQAGLAGGMRVVALSTTHAAPELGGAHLVTAALGPELLPEIDRWF